MIAGVSDSISGLSSQLQLAVGFHKTSPILLYFGWIFDAIKENFYSYDLSSEFCFAVFFKESFIMQVMFKEIKFWGRTWKFLFIISNWNNYCLLRLHQIALGQSSHCPVLAEKKKKKEKKNAVSSFLQLKIWKNLFKKLLAQEHASFVSILCSSEYNSFYQECSVSYLINVKLSASLTWM